MNYFRNLSIKAKLTVLLVSTVAGALFLVCSAFILIDIYSYRESLVKHISALTDVVGANVQPTVEFDDAQTAEELLTSLKNEKSVVYAVVYDRDQNLMASYRRQDYLVALNEQLSDKHLKRNKKSRYTDEGLIEVLKVFADEDDFTGAMIVGADMSQFFKRVWNYGILVSSIILFVLVGTIIISSRLQRVISQPIIRLAKMAKLISEQNDYSLDIKTNDIGNDEIGTLYNEFNEMIIQIRNRENALKEAHDRLEERVESRTRMLSKANQELVQEVFERKKAQDELQLLQAEHLETARQAGMAEIATSVLHNVGNVLNSVNVSSSIITAKLKKSKSNDFKMAMDILQSHKDDIGTYVVNDPQGKHLPSFLIELSEELVTDEEKILKEVEALSKNIGHIKDIISVQQSYAGVSGLTEKACLEELMEQAININEASMKRHEIEIIRDFEEIEPIVIEKHKLLQVLVNLISNAKNALREYDTEHRTIWISIKKVGSKIEMTVKDNGTGIPEDILTKIFAHGFTTRVEGHGFGLHSSALTIKQMGGTLVARSDGVNTGAEFKITLPVNIPEKEAAIY